MAVIGLDIGSTQAKCGVFDGGGKLLKVFCSEYGIVRSGGFSYADAHSMWESTKSILSQAASLSEIDGICVTSFGESFVPVTKHFEILSDSMLYTDPRGESQAEQLKSKISDAEVFKITGNKTHSMYGLPKMMWLKENEPEIYNRADYLLPIAGFIQFMLSGEAACDYSLCARTVALDIRKKQWDDGILLLAGIDKEKLPKVVRSGSIIGNVRREIASELSLKPTCKIIAGGHDQVCSALGAGVLSPGASVDGIGTVECITPVFAEPISDLGMAADGYACIPYAADDLYVTYMFNYTGGAMLKWFRDKIVPHHVKTLQQSGQTCYGYYNKAMPDMPNDLLVLPHFAGAATPYMDLGAKGGILNMTLETTPEDIYRAILEGTTFEMRLNAERVKAYGVDIRELTATGGGAKSKEWLQIKADIMGVPVFPLENEDAGLTGAAMLALAALGEVKDLSEAAKLLVRKKPPLYPNIALSTVYDEKFDKYKKLYNILKEVR